MLPDSSTAYRDLLTSPAMIASLLRSFVREDWAHDIDFSPLEKLDWRSVTRDGDRVSDVDLTAALSRLEQSQKPEEVRLEDLRTVLTALLQRWQEPEQAGLRRAAGTFLLLNFLETEMPGWRTRELDWQEIELTLAKRASKQR